MSSEAVKALRDARSSLDKTREAIDKSNSAMEKRMSDLETKMAQRGPGFTKGTHLPGADAEEFSFAKAIWALKSKSWKDAGYEREVLVASAEKGGFDVASVKAASLGSDVNLGNLVPNNIMAGLIPLLRAEMKLDAMGVNMMSGLSGSPVEMVRQTGTGTGYWVGENKAITESDTETDMIRLRPHKAAALSKISNTLLRAGTSGAEQFVRRSLVQDIAHLVQTAFFEGNGSGSQPLGIRNQLGIQDAGTFGTPTIIKLQEMIDLLRRANVPETSPNVNWVFHPAVLAGIEQIVAGDATQRQGAPILTRGDPTLGTPNRILGIPYQMTTDITATDIYLARWDWTMLGDWGPMDIAITGEAGSAFENDQTWIRVIQEVDVNVAQPTAVVYSSGVTIPS